jgi:hypothetical protein
LILQDQDSDVLQVKIKQTAKQTKRKTEDSLTSTQNKTRNHSPSPIEEKLSFQNTVIREKRKYQKRTKNTGNATQPDPNQLSIFGGHLPQTDFSSTFFIPQIRFNFQVLPPDQLQQQFPSQSSIPSSSDSPDLLPLKKKNSQSACNQRKKIKIYQDQQEYENALFFTENIQHIDTSIL